MSSSVEADTPAARAYYLEHREAIEEFFEDALNAAFEEGAPDPVRFIASWIVSSKPVAPESLALPPMPPQPPVEASFTIGGWVGQLELPELVGSALLAGRPDGTDAREYLCGLSRAAAVRLVTGSDAPAQGLPARLAARVWRALCALRGAELPDVMEEASEGGLTSAENSPPRVSFRQRLKPVMMSLRFSGAMREAGAAHARRHAIDEVDCNRVGVEALQQPPTGAAVLGTPGKVWQKALAPLLLKMRVARSFRDVTADSAQEALDAEARQAMSEASAVAAAAAKAKESAARADVEAQATAARAAAGAVEALEALEAGVAAVASAEAEAAAVAEAEAAAAAAKAAQAMAEAEAAAAADASARRALEAQRARSYVVQQLALSIARWTIEQRVLVRTPWSRLT